MAIVAADHHVEHCSNRMKGKLTAEGFFERYFRRDVTFSDLSALGDVLPDDLNELRDIQMHCLRAVRTAMQSGSLVEMRRLDLLARELGKLARRRARRR